jgi:hypothetical protein
MTNSQKSHGLIMSAPMILAYPAGRKTQTRRLKGLDRVNENPDEWKFQGFTRLVKKNLEVHATLCNMLTGEFLWIKPPYGWTEDTLYFKETFQVWKPWGSAGDEWIGDEVMEFEGHLPKYPPEEFPGSEWNTAYRADNPDFCKSWRSSMFMPRAYSRFQNIPITNVRVERLQAIAESDARNEGCTAKTESPAVMP